MGPAYVCIVAILTGPSAPWHHTLSSETLRTLGDVSFIAVQKRVANFNETRDLKT